MGLAHTDNAAHLLLLYAFADEQQLLLTRRNASGTDYRAKSGFFSRTIEQRCN